MEALGVAKLSFDMLKSESIIWQDVVVAEQVGRKKGTRNWGDPILMFT